MGTDQRNYVKILAAVIGGSAVVAMGALAMTIPQGQVAPDVAKSTNMTVGVTTTTTPLSVEATPMATPKLKGPAPLPPEEVGLP